MTRRFIYTAGDVEWLFAAKQVLHTTATRSKYTIVNTLQEPLSSYTSAGLLQCECVAQLNSARSEDYAELNCDRVAQYHNVDARKNDMSATCLSFHLVSRSFVLQGTKKKKKKNYEGAYAIPPASASQPPLTTPTPHSGAHSLRNYKPGPMCAVPLGKVESRPNLPIAFHVTRAYFCHKFFDLASRLPRDAPS